jgi:hypothetical protein
LWPAVAALAQRLAQTRRAVSTRIRSAPQSPAPVVITAEELHGVVKSGNIPLPGVTVTAQNTLTGKRFPPPPTSPAPGR